MSAIIFTNKQLIAIKYIRCCATFFNFSMFVNKYNLLTMTKKRESHYEFKYEGDNHYININTLLSSQFHFSAIIQEVKSDIFPNIKLDVKVKSFEKGSFDVNQLIEVSAVTGLFAMENIEYVKTIFSTISEIISIKKFLKGEKADKAIEKGDKVELTINLNGKNNTLKIGKDAFKIYTGNKIVNEALIQDVKTLDADEEIKGIKLTEKKSGQVIIDVPREDFSEIDYDNPYLVKEEDSDERIKQVNVGIQKWETVPKKNSKWSLIYENRIINQVVIRDEDFLKRILEEKLRFGAGDSLAVDLLIKLKKDEYSGMFLEDKFEILKVHGIKWRGEQTSLF